MNKNKLPGRWMSFIIWHIKLHLIQRLFLNVVAAFSEVSRPLSWWYSYFPTPPILQSKFFVTRPGWSLEGDNAKHHWNDRGIWSVRTCAFFLDLQQFILSGSMEEPFGLGTASIGFQLELERSKSSSQMSQKNSSEYQHVHVTRIWKQSGI